MTEHACECPRCGETLHDGERCDDAGCPLCGSVKAMTEPAELLPCPFCGPGNSQVSFWHDDVSKAWRVGCGRCGVSSGIHPYDRTQTKAAESWNTRHSQAGSKPWSMANALTDEAAAKVNAALATPTAGQRQEWVLFKSDVDLSEATRSVQSLYDRAQPASEASSPPMNNEIDDKDLAISGLNKDWNKLREALEQIIVLADNCDDREAPDLLSAVNKVARTALLSRDAQQGAAE